MNECDLKIRTKERNLLEGEKDLKIEQYYTNRHIFDKIRK